MAYTVIARAQATASSPAVPYDDINASNMSESTTLNGGGSSSCSVVDSEGEKAWQLSGYYQIAFQGGSVDIRSVASPPSDEVTTTVIRLKTITQSPTSWEITCAGTTDSFATPNRHVLRYSGNDSLSASVAQSSNGLTSAPTLANTMQTFVIRGTNSSSDEIAVWWSGGGPGDAADDTSTPTFNASAVDTFIIGCPTTSQIHVFDVLFLEGAITDAECRAIANNVRTEFPTSGAGLSFSGSIANQQFTINEAITPIDLSGEWSNGTPPLSYSDIGTTLPAGLSFDTGTAVLSGTPTAYGTTVGHQFRCTDDVPASADSNTFQIEVIPAAGDVLAENIPSTGTDGAAPAFYSLSLPADNGTYIRTEAVGAPSPSGTYTQSADMSATFDRSGGADGTYTQTLELFQDNVSLGTFAATFTYGDIVSGDYAKPISKSIVQSIVKSINGD